jgi:hypothetical protein
MSVFKAIFLWCIGALCFGIALEQIFTGNWGAVTGFGLAGILAIGPNFKEIWEMLS